MTEAPRELFQQCEVSIETPLPRRSPVAKLPVRTWSLSCYSLSEYVDFSVDLDQSGLNARAEVPPQEGAFFL
jgi:hypothetical protein